MNKKKHHAPFSITAISSSVNPYNSYTNPSILRSKTDVSALGLEFFSVRIWLSMIFACVLHRGGGLQST